MGGKASYVIVGVGLLIAYYYLTHKAKAAAPSSVATPANTGDGFVPSYVYVTPPATYRVSPTVNTPGNVIMPGIVPTIFLDPGYA